MEVGPENGDKEKKTLWENRLYICDMFFDPYFEKIVPENIKSVIYNACKINPNLKDSIWIPMDYKSEKFTIGLQGIQNAIKILEKDCNKKVILLSNNSIPVLEKNNIVSEGCISVLDYFLQLEMYPGFRFLTFADCNDKNNIKSLYTKNDRFTDGKLSEVEVLLSDKFALKKTIYYCLEQLTKFDEFSFDYEYNEDNSDELTKTLKELCRLFNARFPGFFNSPDELVKFLKYQMPRLITKPEELEIEKMLLPMKSIILDQKADVTKNKNQDSVQGGTFDKYNNSEEYKAVTDYLIEHPIEMQITFTVNTAKPPVDYNLLSDEVKAKLNEVKHRFPNYFFSGKDVLYYILGIWGTNKLESGNKNIKGVFCDIDDTLVVNGHINYKVLEKLVSYYNKGKFIQLWTAGSIYKKKGLLSKLLFEFENYGLSIDDLCDMGMVDIYYEGEKYDGYEWNIENKYDYEGLKPEIVIDDWCYKRFLYQINATPKSFINVNDL